MKYCLKRITATTFCLILGMAQASLSFAQQKQAVLAELTSKLDTKSAKVDDVVTAKTIADLKMADGTTLAKGSKLSGKVTQVASKAAGNGTASVSILFDQAAIKGGESKPIHGVLVAIAPRPSLSDEGASSSALPAASTRSVASTTQETGAGLGPASVIGASSMPSGSSVKGVQLDGNLNADGSASLHSTDKDIRLESGMRVEVGLM